MRWYILLIFSAILVFTVILYLLLDKPERIITPAVFRVYNTAQICPLLPTCFYQNIDTPYGRVLFPNTGLSPLERYFGVTTLATDQAIVIIGTPPPTQYWSFIPYLWRKADSDQVLFASLSDSVSKYNTILPPSGQIAVIITRNRDVYQAERNYILSTNFDGAIYPLFIPDVIGDEYFTILFRATIFPDETVLQKYINSPSFTAYTSQYPSINVTLCPLSLPDQTPQPYGVNLRTLPLNQSEVYISADFDLYTASIISQYTITNEVIITPFLIQELGIPWNNGYQCIANNLNCQGDNRDTFYAKSDPLVIVAPAKLVVTAVNHARLGRAIYTSISIYDDTKQFGLDSIIAEPNDPLFYSHEWDIQTSGTYRIVERAYVQLPDAVAPDVRSVLVANAYVVMGGTRTDVAQPVV